MKKITLTIFFLLLFLNQSTPAQSIGLSFGGGYVTSAIDKAELPYWGNGYLINFSSDIKINNRVSLFISSTFQKHFFNENLVTLAVPQVAGYNYSINGENSSVVELSFGGRIYANDSRIKPYLGIGAGVLFIDQGKVEITDWMEGSQDRTTNLYANTGRNFNTAQINIGIGLEIGVINNLQFVVDGKFVQSFNGLSYVPVTASVKMGL